MRAKKEKPSPKARGVRFKPDYGDYARIEVGSKGKLLIPSLIINESFAGCCLVLVMPATPLKVSTVYRVQVGKLNPMNAELIWMQVLDKESQLIKAGFEFRDNAS